MSEQNLSTSWQFEPRGYVVGYTERFNSTNTGPSTSVQRSFDPYGQVATESVGNGASAYNASQTWDATGRRTMLNVAGGNYGYAWQADGSLIYASNPTASGSYGYDTAGLLTNRLVYGRNTAITSRDGEGRPLTIATTLNTAPELTETLGWSGDGLLATHSLVRGDHFTDNRSYAYANQSRRLTQEQLNLNASSTWTNSFVYDRGVTGGIGALTTAGPTGSSFGLWWSGIPDAFSHVNTETNNSIGFLAYGAVNGQATLSAWLDSQPIQILDVGTNNMQWRTFLELSQGTHQLKVNALHPSGFYTASATNSFTNSIPNQVAHDINDGGGNITNRVWVNASGVTNRMQTLSYDALGRLHQVVELNTNNYGFIWTASYDALNRRLSTTTTLVSNNVPSTVPPQVLSSYYDPLVEFLELGVQLNSAPQVEFLQAGTSPSVQTVWKFYGPDLNGQYGGENGTGGLEGVSPYLNTFNPVISDARGNVLAEVTNGVPSWMLARPTGYGAVPGYRPVAYGNGVDLAQSCVFRGREVDVTGYHHFGMRDYDPVSGQWLSYDPAWNERDPNGQSYCGGDPINNMDSDGRIANDFYASAAMQNPQFNPYGTSDFGMLVNNFYSPNNDGYQTSGQLLFSQAVQSLYPNEQLGYFDELTYDQRSTVVNLMSYALGQSDSFEMSQTSDPGFSLSDTLLNTQARSFAASQWNSADWSSGWGITMKIASGIDYAANTIDAGANMIPVLGGLKTGGEGLIKAGIKGLTEAAGDSAAKGTVTLYHGTTTSAARSILSSGFNPGVDNAVFFGEDFSTARFFGESAMAENGASSGQVLRYTIPQSLAEELGLTEQQILGEFRGAPPIDIPGSTGFERILNGDNIDIFNQAVQGGQISVKPFPIKY